MSGAEVAGLVLGAIPLILSGLESYIEGVKLIGKIRNASKEFERLKERLELEYDIFLNTLEILLQDSVDDQSLRSLLSDLGGEQWSEPRIEQCLRNRLRRSYHAFQNGVAGMLRSLAQLKDSLQISDQGKGPFENNKWSVKEGLKKLKFGLKMKAYVQSLEDISRSNSCLDKIATQTSVLEPIRISRKRTHVPNFDIARAHATSIFASLQGALSRTCGIAHQASLYMKPAKLQQAESERGPNEEEVSFRIVLHHAPAIDKKPLWNIAEAEIRFLHKASEEDGEAVVLQQEVQVRRAKSVVKFSQQIHELKDICSNLHQLRTANQGVCLGYLSNAVERSRHGVYWPKVPLLIESTTTSINLSNILADNRALRLSESDKRRLALALALGMLRLYETPWLHRQWGARDIVLFQKPNGLLAEHPFISRDLNWPVSGERDVGGRTYFQKCAYIREETTFALGVLLIELCLEKSFHDLSGMTGTGRHLDGPRDPASDYLLADALVDQVYDRAGLKWGDTVRRCIRCDFDQRNRTLHDQAFRKAVYEKVVSVLESDVEEHQYL